MQESYESQKIERLRRAMYSRALSDQFRVRDRRIFTNEQELVGNDWIREEPQMSPVMSAPRGLNTARIVLWWTLGLAILFCIGAVIFFIYYVSLGGGSAAASASNIDISIAGPAQVSGGSPTELQISITNRNAVALQLADLIIKYPPGTRLIGSNTPSAYTCSGTQDKSPTALDVSSYRICLGTIAPGAVKPGIVSAVLSGKQGEQQDVKVELEYHLAGSSAIFHRTSDYALTFSSSPLSIAVQGNSEVISGQPILLTATVTSNAATLVKDALLSVTYPFGFRFISGDPVPKNVNSTNGLWQLGDMNPGDIRTITLRGVLTGEENDARAFNFNAGTRSNSATTSITSSLASSQLNMKIAQPFLGLSVLINNTSGSSMIVAPEDNVAIQVNYQNNLDSEINNPVIVAKLSGIQIDGSTVHSTNGFYRSSDDSIIWNKDTAHGTLDTLKKGDKGTLDFSFKMPSSDILKNILNPHIDISINASGNRLSESGVPQTLQSTTNAHIALASDLILTANTLYYSSPYGATGPIPPVANKETTYAMVFTVTNSTSLIKGATVSAILPPYVRWTGKSSPSSEHLDFNRENNTITWRVGDIAANTGLNGSPARQIGFEIGFTPSTSQIGQQPILLQNSTLKGLDTVAGVSVERKVPDTTTNLIGDTNFNATNATVIAPSSK